MSKSISPRRVAIALIIHTASISAVPRFLIVSSRKHKDRWVLPKGGIERAGGSEQDGGETEREAAERESWEEAGLVLGSANHLTHLVVLPDEKPHSKSSTQNPTASDFIPSTLYSFELFSVSSDGPEILAEDWPEKNERERKWVQGWKELEEILCWGRRENVMRKAISLARKRFE